MAVHAQDSVCTMPAEVQEKAEQLLDNMMKMQGTGQTFSLKDSAYDPSYSDFSGYNVEDAYARYYFSIHRREKYASTGSFASMVSDSPHYVVPYHNEYAEGLIYISEDKEGALKVTERVLSQKSIIQPEAIDDIAAQFEDVEDVRLVVDFIAGLQLVYVRTEAGEYLVPCASDVIDSYFTDLKRGAVYEAAEFMNWVEYGFDWAGFDPMADGSGVPNYIGYELTPVEMKKDLPDYVVPAGVSALSLAGAGALAFGGVKRLKKKKQDV